MAWLDATDPSYWDEEYYNVKGTWNGTAWVPNGAGEIYQRCENNWLDGQSPGYWRFTLNVASGALGNTSDLDAFVVDASFQYNTPPLSFALLNGVNTIQQVIFFGGANPDLGDVREFRLNSRDSISYTLTKIEFGEPDPSELCVLYKHTGFVLLDQTTPKSPSESVNGSSVVWKKPVTSPSGRWLDPTRPGVTAIRSSKVSIPQSPLPDTSTSDSMFLLASQGLALIVEKDEHTSSIVYGKGDVKVPVYTE